VSFSASTPAANVLRANATLEAAGFGPSNFSVPVYDGPRPTHATLHAWSDAAFQAAVEALPGVTVSSIDGTPAERVSAAVAGLGEWGGDAPLLEGQVTPGLHRDVDGNQWWVIQAYDTNTWPDPTVIPALVRRARTPGEVAEWVQPRDQFDAYLLEDPFTGEPERVTHNGTRYETLVDFNVWEPGTDPTLWQEIDADGNPVEPPAGDTWTNSGATFEGVVGGGVINVSDTSVFQTPEAIRIGGIEVNATSVFTPGAPGILAIDSTPSELQFETPNGTPIEVRR